MVKDLEKEKGRNFMRFDASSITPSKKLASPAKKGDLIDVELRGPGRNPGEAIGVFEHRNITVLTDGRTNGKVKVRILRAKHNIFFGKVL